MTFSYTNSAYPIREDITQAYQAFWHKLARPGAWWSGAQRIAIAAEVRNAVECQYCQVRKSALSPYTTPGKHKKGNLLSDTAVDAAHMIITDQGRITQAFIDKAALQGLSNEHYVELTGIVVAVFSIDEFNRALGIPVEPLPQPVAGAPSHYRPANLSTDTGFVPMVSVDGAVGNERGLWPTGRSANVVRALTLVPDALRDWFNLASAQYLSLEGMSNLVRDDNRSINRMQMELIAGRVSAINECFY
ncbi:MAG TPA: hypothetical protein EYQ22_07435 [Gammaproteobacteria bacterium]|nr:hypothetical protein [Gammaproteobacteria bacterium]HIK69620.1 hypothetical protein [Pseudomonadales bacterium]